MYGLKIGLKTSELNKVEKTQTTKKSLVKGIFYIFEIPMQLKKLKKIQGCGADGTTTFIDYQYLIAFSDYFLDQLTFFALNFDISFCRTESTISM